MKSYFFKTTNWVYGFIIGLLGFSQGCSSFGNQADMYGPPVPAYGTPYAEHIISGKVTDAENNPIKNIEVNLSVYGGMDLGRTNTDENGAFNLKDNTDANDFILKFKDIDGEENGGEFDEKSQPLKFEDSDYTGAEGWYIGKAEKTVNIKMDKKTE